MTTGRINQVASLSRRRSRRTRISWSGRDRCESGRGSRADGATALRAPLLRNRVVAFVSGSPLTTSPAASAPSGLRSWVSRRMGLPGRKTLLLRRRFRVQRRRHGAMPLADPLRRLFGAGGRRFASSGRTESEECRSTLWRESHRERRRFLLPIRT